MLLLSFFIESRITRLDHIISVREWNEFELRHNFKLRRKIVWEHCWFCAGLGSGECLVILWKNPRHLAASCSSLCKHQKNVWCISYFLVCDCSTSVDSRVPWYINSSFCFLMQFLALLFGCVPLLRSLIFTEHSFLYFLFDSLNILGLVPHTRHFYVHTNT